VSDRSITPVQPAKRSRLPRPFGRLPHERKYRAQVVAASEAYLSVATQSRFIAPTVLTLKTAVTRDVHGGAESLSNEMARWPVVGRIPVHCLMLDFL
jgi:hypothetical protein